MYDEEDLLPLSALQHLVFCERRAALICVERLWADNVATVQGSHLHERAHQPATESRPGVRIARALQLRSLQLGVSGVADVVEFHADPGGIPLEGVEGLWRPFPVEYKRGRLRHEPAYAVQLCAQALCIEEMLGVAVPAGAVYYGATARRLEVAFIAALRLATEDAAARLHDLVRASRTPSPHNSPKCRECSMAGLCLPAAVGSSQRAARYLRAVFEVEDDPPPARNA